MTPEQNKLIFDYCGFKIGWGCKRLNSELKQNCIKSENPVLLHCLPDDANPCIYYYDEYRELDGNDILEAVNVMEKEEDLLGFQEFVDSAWEKDRMTTRELCLIPWLLQNFFNLMAQWLEKRK